MVFVLKGSCELPARVYGQEVADGTWSRDDAGTRGICKSLLPNGKICLVALRIGVLLRAEVGVERGDTPTTRYQLAARTRQRWPRP